MTVEHLFTGHTFPHIGWIDQPCAGKRDLLKDGRLMRQSQFNGHNVHPLNWTWRMMGAHYEFSLWPWLLAVGLEPGSQAALIVAPSAYACPHVWTGHGLWLRHAVWPQT